MSRIRGRGDRGAILVIVAVFSLVAVLMLAAVIDLGNQRGQGKQVTLATDASALAAAASIDFRDPAARGAGVVCGAVGSTDVVDATVGAVAERYWRENGGTGPLDCRITFDGLQAGNAYVTVAATNEVEYQFSGVTGQRSGSVRGVSSARVAPATAGILYPVGLCTEGATAMLEGHQSRTFEPPTSTAVTFDARCGGSGNKRQIQFRPGLRGDACAGVGMWCWDFRNGGYDMRGGTDLAKIVESDTGKDWQKAEGAIAALSAPRAKPPRFWIPAVAARPDLGVSGTFAKYQITHFVEVHVERYSKRTGLGFFVHRIVPFAAGGPPAPGDVNTARVHICGTGPGVAACDTKVGPPVRYVTPDPVLDFRDLCKVTGITPSTQLVRVDATDRLTAPVTVSYTVADPLNCDPPVTLRAVSTLRTVAATPGVRTGSTYPFTFPTGTLLGPDATDFTLQLHEDAILADSTGRLSTLGPCRVRSASVTPGGRSISAAGNALTEAIAVRVELSRPDTCSGLVVRIVERKNNPVTNTIYAGSPTTATLDIPLPAGTTRFPNGSTWDIVVLQGTTPLAYTPTGSFAT